MTNCQVSSDLNSWLFGLDAECSPGFRLSNELGDALWPKQREVIRLHGIEVVLDYFVEAGDNVIFSMTFRAHLRTWCGKRKRVRLDTENSLHQELFTVFAKQIAPDSSDDLFDAERHEYIRIHNEGRKRIATRSSSESNYVTCHRDNGGCQEVIYNEVDLAHRATERGRSQERRRLRREKNHTHDSYRDPDDPTVDAWY